MTAARPRRLPNTTGAVAAGHRLTAQAGAEALAIGGNAVDAALAAAFAAAVVEGPLTGLGAGGFMLVRRPGEPATLLDFFVAVPGAGPDGRRLDPAELGSHTVRFGGADQVFHIGPASVAVPGMLPGLAEAHRRWCRLPVADLVAPAVRIAREGCAVGDESAYLHEILDGILLASPEGASVYAPGGELLRAGGTLRNPDLATTFELIAQLGFERARREVVEPAILGTLAGAGGLITAEDLAGYAVIERAPLEARYRDATLLTNPPPSSGGVLIAAALAWLDAGPAPRTALEHYLGAVRAGEVANALRDERFAEDLHMEDAVARVLARRAPPSSRKPTGTTHISAVDAEGGMASFSSSNGSASGVVAAGTGVLLNNMMGEEDLNPGGLGLARPGRRLSSMMAPTIVMRGADPYAALGSAGSNRLRSAILQTVMSLLDAELPPAAAIARPRVHPEGDGVDIEGGVPEEVAAALAADGRRLRRWEGMNLFFGGVSAVRTGDGPPRGAGDPRRGGGAAAATADGRVVPL